MENKLDEPELPLVSVILPSYNHSRYVAKAILSVLHQTYTRIQLIVIDDGSQDDSVACIRSLQRKFDFILKTQSNMGVCKTLNRAIRESATGDYIALIASDDFWHPEKLSLQMERILEFPDSEFCFSQAIEFVDETNPNYGRVFPRQCLTGKILNQVFVRQHVPAGTILFSKGLYDRLGGFDENLKEEDWDFVIRSAAATSFVAVDKPLLYYRAHAENTMRTRSRNLIFHQKCIILSKNYLLVSPQRWLFCILLHFFYDIVLCRLLRR